MYQKDEGRIMKPKFNVGDTVTHVTLHGEHLTQGEVTHVHEIKGDSDVTFSIYYRVDEGKHNVKPFWVSYRNVV